MLPNPDNALNLGNGSFRWKEVFSAAGAINTSDAREKSALRPLSDAERRAVRRVMAGVGMFQWLSAIAEKGEGARLHAGVTAQAVAEAFIAEGLDPERYGLFCADAVVERIDVAETVRVRRPVKREVEQDVLELVDGRPRLVKQVVSETVTEERPVEDAAGEAVLSDGKPVLAAVLVMEEVEETVIRSEERPVLDETGGQLVRLGVRYDQLFAIALAALNGG